VLTLYQSRRIREESAFARRERDKAFEVRNFLLEMFGTSGPDQPTGDTVTARELLDRRAATLDAAYAEDPETRAEMMYVLAEGYEKLGLFGEADPLARGSLELRTALYGKMHPDVVASMNLVGWLHHQSDRPAEAEAQLREAVAIGRAVMPHEGDPRLARALNDLGVVREDRGAYDEAAELYRESLAMRRRARRDENVGVAVTMSNLSVVQYRRGQVDAAIAMADSSLQLFKRALGEDHQRTTIVQSNLAAFQAAKGDYDGAVKQYRDILERRRRLLGPRHGSIPASLNRVAITLKDGGHFAEAETTLEESLTLMRSGDFPTRDLAHALRVLGDLKARSGRNAEALADMRSSLALMRQIFGDANEYVLYLFVRIAAVSESAGNPAEAEFAQREAARVAALLHGETHAVAHEMKLRVVELLGRQGRSGEARIELARFEVALKPAVIARDTALARRVQSVKSGLGR
jgi:tetratricopeptide (TPR) repeat protein